MYYYRQELKETPPLVLDASYTITELWQCRRTLNWFYTVSGDETAFTNNNTDVQSTDSLDGFLIEYTEYENKVSLDELAPDVQELLNTPAVLPWYWYLWQATDITDSSFTISGDLQQFRDSSEVNIYFEYRVEWTSIWYETDKTTTTEMITVEETIDWLTENTPYSVRMVIQDSSQLEYKSYTPVSTITTKEWNANWQDVTDELYHWFKFDKLENNKFVDEMWNRNMSTANWIKVRRWNGWRVCYADGKNDFAWLYSRIGRNHSSYWVVKFKYTDRENCIFDYSNNSWLYVDWTDIYLVDHDVEVFRVSHNINIKDYNKFTLTVKENSRQDLYVEVYVWNVLVWWWSYKWWYNYNRRVAKSRWNTYTKLYYDTYRIYKKPLTAEEISILVANI